MIVNNISPRNISTGPMQIAKGKFYLETYGCQMNVADSELVVSILQDSGFMLTTDYKDADAIFINTCSIRENAELRVKGRLDNFRHLKKKTPHLIVGILGCMAERLKDQWLDEDKLVDMVVGPDAYRELPDLIKLANTGEKAINVILSRDETYSDISPVRLDKNGVTSFVSIMRGCDNMCAYCVVPFTRGRERSRNYKTIISEVEDLVVKGYKEVTLLGQNVDKYNWNDGEVNFAHLLEIVAKVSPELRVRFSTSYPQDITDEVLEIMAKYHNICKYIHLPVQSGSNKILELMKRGYTREHYMQRVESIRRIIPDCAISTDIIAGFCSETEQDHKDTLSLMKWAKFDYAYMFQYSERPNTLAQRKYQDDVPDEVKTHRLTQIIELQNHLSLESNKLDLGKVFEVLVEGVSKKSGEKLFGRNSQNKVVVFPKEHYKIGDYANVLVKECTSATLKGVPVL